MDDLFGKIDCRSKYDSVVMRILRSAMDKAHEDMQNMNGPIEFLHERSKFYEFATILVEGGLSIVEEETDVHESNREKIVYDLIEIKNWLQGRIEEMRMLIVEKDKELIESLENELKLRHALELNEKELEQTKSNRVEDFLQRNRENQEDEADDIQELKIVVDQKAKNIKHILEMERRKKSLSNVSDSEVYSRIFDDDGSPSARSVEDELHRHEEFFDIKPLNRTFKPSKKNKMIQQMTSDIVILKKNLGLAFGRMENAKLLPLEKQWKCTIEKDIMLVLVRGFICDIQQSFNAEMRKICCKTSREVMTNDLKSIRDELNVLCNENHRSIIRPLSSKSLTGSSSEQSEDHLGHVARMMKNHQSIRQKHHEEKNWLKREILLWKGSPAAFVTDKKLDEFQSRILEEITRLDNLIACYNNNQLDAKHACDETDMIEDSDNTLSFEQLNVFAEYLKSSIREEIYVVYFQEKLKEWNKDMGYNRLFNKVLCEIKVPSGFQQIQVEFDQTVHKKLDAKNSRLEDLKNQVDLLAESVVSIRQRKMLYKKAFLNRCINLQLAENEVDLLGNEVEKLLSLLQKIYLILSQNAKVLYSCNVEISETLRLIKKELAG